MQSGLVKGKFNAKEQCSLALEVRRRSWDINEFQRSQPIIVLSQIASPSLKPIVSTLHVEAGFPIRQSSGCRIFLFFTVVVYCPKLTCRDAKSGEYGEPVQWSSN